VDILQKALVILDQLPLWQVMVFALLLGLAPFTPEPHLIEKLRMLVQGTLTRPIDIFDLLFHAVPVQIGLVKLYRVLTAKG
jgi:hypothetical protein